MPPRACGPRISDTAARNSLAPSSPYGCAWSSRWKTPRQSRPRPATVCEAVLRISVRRVVVRLSSASMRDDGCIVRRGLLSMPFHRSFSTAGVDRGGTGAGLCILQKGGPPHGPPSRDSAASTGSCICIA